MTEKPTLQQQERLRIIRQPRRSHSVSVALRVEEEHTLQDTANELNPKRHDIRDTQKRNSSR
jgi:hypothetical protein